MVKVPGRPEERSLRSFNPTGLPSTRVESPLGRLGATLSKIAEAKDNAQDLMDQREFKANHEEHLLALQKQINARSFKEESDATEFLKKESDKWINENIGAYRESVQRSLRTIGKQNQNRYMANASSAYQADRSVMLNESWAREASALRDKIEQDPDNYLKYISEWNRDDILSKKFVNINRDEVRRTANTVSNQALIAAARKFARVGRLEKGLDVINKHTPRLSSTEKEKEIDKLYRIADQQIKVNLERELRAERRLKLKREKRQAVFTQFISEQLSGIDLDKPNADEKLMGVKAIIHDDRFNFFTDAKFKEKLDKMTRAKWELLSRYNLNPMYELLVDGTTKGEFMALLNQQKNRGLTDSHYQQMLKIAEDLGSSRSYDSRALTAETDVIKKRFKEEQSYWSRKYGNDDDLRNMMMTEAVAKFYRILPYSKNPYEARQLVLASYIGGSKAKDRIPGLHHSAFRDAASLTAAKMDYIAEYNMRKKSNNPIPDEEYSRKIIAIEDMLEVMKAEETLKNRDTTQEVAAEVDRILQSNVIPNNVLPPSRQETIPMQSSMEQKQVVDIEKSIMLKNVPKEINENFTPANIKENVYKNTETTLKGIQKASGGKIKISPEKMKGLIEFLNKEKNK